jgi:lysophospholipase L1-like esterase
MRTSLDGVRPFPGTYLTHVRFNAAATEQAPATRSNPLVVICDSTLEGFYADNPAEEGCIQKLRLNLPALYDGVIMYGAGGYSLFAAGPDATARQALAELLTALSPRAILINLGGNDWLNNYWSGLANYQAALEDLLDKLLAEFGGRVFVDGVFTPPTGSEYLDDNAIGESISDLRATIAAAVTAVGSTRLTYLDLTSVISEANFDADLKHPNVAGHDELYQFFRVAIAGPVGIRVTVLSDIQ